MPVDWVCALRERGDLAASIAKDLTDLLTHPGASEEQLIRLFNLVNRHCQAVDELVDQIEAEIVEESVSELAEAVQELWSDLAEALASRLIAFRGR